MRTRLALALMVAAGAGCDDFASPAELDRPQLAGIRAEPATVTSGGRARLDALILGPEGETAPDSQLWRVVPTLIGEAPAGSVEQDAMGTSFVAPASGTGIATVELTATVGEATLVGIKAIAFGAPVPIPNPMLPGIEIDGALVTDETPVAPEASVALRAELVPTPGPDAEYSWYSNVGTIEEYRSQAAVMEIPNPAEPGVLIVVGRDGIGGISWRTVRLIPQ